MRAPVLIIGQGLAGTALGLELEAAGIAFRVVSEGHARAASRVAAGLINPITGQRFVKSWRVDALRPLARAAFARWEQMLNVPLWHDVQFERRFADDRERERATRKFATGELAPFASAVTDEALVLTGAAWVNLPLLLATAAERWRRAGWLHEEEAAEREFEFGGSADARSGTPLARWRATEFEAVICCTGHGPLGRAWFAGAPFAAVKGQILRVRGAGLAADVVRHRRRWLLGERAGEGRVGATFEPCVEDLTPTAAARAELLAAARELLPGTSELDVVEQAAGVRLALADKLPAADWHPKIPRLGFFGALGSKGALWAPWLAERWRAALGHGQRLPIEVSLARFMTPAAR